MGAYRHHLTTPRCSSRVIGPISHEPLPLLEQIASPVCGLNFALNGMGERHLDYF
jgi:hypothetical protein